MHVYANYIHFRLPITIDNYNVISSHSHIQCLQQNRSLFRHLSVSCMVGVHRLMECLW